MHCCVLLLLLLPPPPPPPPLNFPIYFGCDKKFKRETSYDISANGGVGVVWVQDPKPFSNLILHIRVEL